MSMRTNWDWKSDLEAAAEFFKGFDILGPFIKETGLEFASNFYEIPGGMYFMGFHVPTSEHAYQMMKTLDLEDRRWIASQPTAALAKKAGSPNGLNGRTIKLREDWNQVSFPIMGEVVMAKFMLL